MEGIDEPAAKKQKTYQKAAEYVESNKQSHVQVTVHTMGGNILLKTSIENTRLGQEVLDLALQQRPPTGTGIGKLLHGTRRVDPSVPLVEQGISNDVRFQFVWQFLC